MRSHELVCHCCRYFGPACVDCILLPFMVASSSMEVKGVTLTTRDDGSIAVVSGPRRLEISCKSLDDIWNPQLAEAAPVTPEMPPAIEATEKKEPIPALSGWRRTKHAAATECMKEIEERVECAEVFNDLDDYPIYQKLVDLTDALRSDPELDKESADETLSLARMYLYLCDMED